MRLSGPGGKLVVALGLGDSILPDLVQQGFVADLQKSRSLFAVPVGLLERLPDGFAFGFVFGGARQRFQTAARFAFRRRISPAPAGAVVAGLQFRDRQIFIPRIK